MHEKRRKEKNGEKEGAVEETTGAYNIRRMC